MKKIYVVMVLLSLVFCNAAQSASAEERWSFTALADPRSDYKTFGRALEEVRNRDALGNTAPSKFILVCGDYDPLSKKIEIYDQVFADAVQRPAFLPVIGNHDLSSSDFTQAAAIVRNLENVTRRDDMLNYYVDYKNVRIIAVNAYDEYGNDLGQDGNTGCLTVKGIEWIESVISSADQADHIFIGMHEPSFPRMRHVSDSFNACQEERDAFWEMLVSHGDKVKAVFVGHTHQYYRMRVKDPAGADADNPLIYPDQEGGIYQVDCGACGNGRRDTLINIEISGKDVFFRVIDAEGGTAQGEFSIIDEWEIRAEEY